MMARLRYGMQMGKKETREKYASMGKRDKASFSKVFKKTGDVDSVLSFKAKEKTKTKIRGNQGLFFSRDELLIQKGWRPEVAQTPFCLRVEQRVDTIISFCKKMGGRDWVRQREQSEACNNYNGTFFVYNKIKDRNSKQTDT